MRTCRLCLEGGYQITPPAVTQGQVSASMMSIGQAPGITEVQAKRPFNAGSGTRLFAWLQQAGIEEGWFRATQYMSSVTKCYPGRSKSGGGDRVPSRAEQKLCRPFLEEEIALVNPKVILPIGGVAIKLFFPAKAKLTEIIGTQVQTPEGRWIVPLPHPSGASRWHQDAQHQMLIRRAIRLIGKHYQKIVGR